MAGGEANLTFGQGKHLIDYLSQKEKDNLYSQGMNLSAHSGIGHIVAYLEEIMKYGLKWMVDRYV